MSTTGDLPPTVGHVLETSLYVGDLDASAAFYQRLFSFEKFYEDQRMCALGVPGAEVLLLFRATSDPEPSATPGGVVPAHGGLGSLHLCFAIAAADLARWEQRLAALDVPMESRVTWSRGGVSLYFRDPDGHSIELATPGLWPNY